MASLSEMDSTKLTEKDVPLSRAEIDRLRQQVQDWQVAEKNEVPRLSRAFKFKNFAEALAFTDRVGALANQQDHHPLICTEWGQVTVSWWTHKVHGLHMNDFIMAAKTDLLYQPA